MSARAKVGAVFVLASTSFFAVPLRATSVVALIDKANHMLVIAADCRRRGILGGFQGVDHHLAQRVALVGWRALHGG